MTLSAAGGRPSYCVLQLGSRRVRHTLASRVTSYDAASRSRAALENDKPAITESPRRNTFGTAALAGGAGGALIGAGIGSLSHARAGEGALIGSAIGAIGGAIVGNEMDRQEQAARAYDAGSPPPPAAPPPVRYESDYGYGPPPPTYSRTYYVPPPRVYYEVRTYRPYHRHRHYYCD